MRFLVPLFFLLLSAGPPVRLAAQKPPLIIAGRMIRVRDADSSALAGAWVIAHEVGEARQGPIDSMRTDGAGRFSFLVPRPDSGAVYVVSSRHQGIGYFSDPVQGAGATPLTLVVFDTSASGPPLAITIRQVVITRGDRGQNRVLDIFQVLNSGKATRVGRDSTMPVWTSRLPAGVVRPQPGEADIPASAIRFIGGRVEVLSPFPPGLKQVVITYDLPAGATSLAVPVDQPTERFEALVEDSSASVSGNLASEDPVAIEGRNFRRWAADSLAVGATPTIRFEKGGGGDPRRFSWIAIAAAALALIAGAVFALRRRPAGAAGEDEPEGDPLDHESDERLIAQIAALDEKFATREAETDPAQWAVYQSRRADLKAALGRRVARP